MEQIRRHFEGIAEEAPDAIFGLVKKFKEDENKEKKVDLVVGAYRTDQGQPWVLPSVLQTEKLLLSAPFDHEYLPLDGLSSFIRSASLLILGNDSPLIASGSYAAIQTLSGSGALRMAGEFLRRFYPFSDVVRLPTPTWPNHPNIFTDSGMKVQGYRYYDPKTISIDFNGLCEDLQTAPSKSIFLFHACAHNPTGVDPSKDQWGVLADICLEKQHVAIFDSAYQGFATGDLNNDAYSVRLFVQKGVEVIACQSFSKNMGLYGERVGNLVVSCDSPETAKKIKSQLTRLTRGMISNCPAHGARICSEILNNPELRAQWEQDVKTMSGRIKEMRESLYNELIDLKTPGSWEHIKNQIGMFAYTGLNASQCEELMSEHHVYLTKNGRISVAGLNSKNVKYVAHAIHSVVSKN